MKNKTDVGRIADLDAILKGSVSEYYVASVIAGYGYEIAIVHGIGFDLLAICPETGKTYRVEVKGASKLAKTPNPEPRLQFHVKNITSKTTDIVAFHYIPTDDLMFVPASSIRDDQISAAIYINSSFEKDPYQTWKESLESLKGGD